MLKNMDKNFICKVFHYFVHEYRTLKITGFILLLLCFIIIKVQDNTSLEQLMNENKKPEMSTESSYSNTVELSRVSDLSIRAGKCSLTASWTQVSGAEGYQVQYAKKKKFSDKAKKKSVRKTRITIKKLEKGIKYYVRVRPYIKSDGKKIYGKWSKKKRRVTK